MSASVESDQLDFPVPKQDHSSQCLTVPAARVGVKQPVPGPPPAEDLGRALAVGASWKAISELSLLVRHAREYKIARTLRGLLRRFGQLMGLTYS